MRVCGVVVEFCAGWGAEGIVVMREAIPRDMGIVGVNYNDVYVSFGRSTIYRDGIWVSCGAVHSFGLSSVSQVVFGVGIVPVLFPNAGVFREPVA